MKLKEQEKGLRKAAKDRGLKVRKSTALEKTPYRAMNPLAAKELGVKCPKDKILYTKQSKKVLDIRHELVEYDEMAKGKTYKTAHKVANRKQRTIGAV